MALTVKKVLQLQDDGRHLDRDGLYLQIKGNNRSWILRYKRFGVTRWMGLGGTALVTLEQARALALEARLQIKLGNDPLEVRRQQQVEEKLAANKKKTFKACVADFLQGRTDDVQSAMETYVYPICGDLPVAVINTDTVLQCLDPIWQNKNPTAKRLRARMEDVFDWAKVRGYRKGDNPASHLEKALPKVVKRTLHRAALPYAEVPAFMETLRSVEGLPARALGKPPPCFVAA